MERIVVNLADGSITNVPLSGEEIAAIEAINTPALVAQKMKARVVQIMIEKQDGGVVFNGLPVSTNNSAIGDLMGAKLAPKASRKIVTRLGGGMKTILTSAQLDSLFNAVEKYRQDVMDKAYDLIVALDAAQDPTTVNINVGWPSNVL